MPMSAILTHKDLQVWQKSMQFVKQLYIITRSYPREEMYGIVSQMRRAAVSVPSNIAEGYGRKSDKDLLRFLSIALGSTAELETQLLISRDLDFLTEDSYILLNNQIAEIFRMLTALYNKVRNDLVLWCYNCLFTCLLVCSFTYKYLLQDGKFY